MFYQRKLNCPICEFPRLTNLSRHLTTVHDISGKERKCLLAKARFSVLSTQQSTPTQFGNSLPKTSPLPEQKKLPNPTPTNSTSDENEDQLIPCPYDSRISYERIWGTNVPVMDYDIFKLHHPFSMLVAGPRGAEKSEFVKQLLALKRFIMTDPPERIVWFYGRHQPDLFCFLTQEIPCIEFYEGLPTNIEVMFDRSKRNICIIDAEREWKSIGRKPLYQWETFESVRRVCQSKFILYRKEMQNHLLEFNLHCGFQESKRSIPNSPSSMSDVPI